MKFHQRLLERYMIKTKKCIVDPFYGFMGFLARFRAKTTTKVGKDIRYEDIKTK